MRSLLLVAASLVVASSTFAQSPTGPTDPPPGQQAVLTVLGRGVQIYVCQQTGGSPQWVLQAPEAALYDSDSVKVGTHGAGPMWTNKDGSSVRGEVLQRSPSPEPGAIPWLLLKASNAQGVGVLSKVEFIRRSQTHGGIASTVGCDAAHLGTTSRIPYTANYTFYSSKP